MSQATASDRRRMLRFPLSIRADIRYNGLDLTGYTADVSVSGAFVRPENDADPILDLLSPGDAVELVLAVGAGEPMVIDARIVHFEDHGIGLLFGTNHYDIFGPRPAVLG